MFCFSYELHSWWCTQSTYSQVSFHCMVLVKTDVVSQPTLLSEKLLINMCFHFTEDNFGKAGRASLLQLLGPQ